MIAIVGSTSNANPMPHFQSRNLLLRPLGNTIYVMTPYCVTEADLDKIYDAIFEAADLFA